MTRLGVDARDLARPFAVALAIALAACGARYEEAPATRSPAAVGTPAPVAVADFRGEPASADARRVAAWVMASADHGGRPFAIVDKREARLHVFAADGRSAGTAPILIGSQVGDHTVPGVGEKAIADVAPHERTTPAGRFVAERGLNARGKPVVWVDYDAAVSMHAVIDDVKGERRLERIVSPDPARHRISYGCINVPLDFFGTVALPAFSADGGVIYVLPDTLRLEQVFPGLADARVARVGG
jgi:hypothetical protein